MAGVGLGEGQQSTGQNSGQQQQQTPPETNGHSQSPKKKRDSPPPEHRSAWSGLDQRASALLHYGVNQLLLPVAVRDQDSRIHALDAVGRGIVSWAAAGGEPGGYGGSTNSWHQKCHYRSGGSASPSIHHVMPSLLAAQITNPYPEVRQRLKLLLDELRKLGYRIPRAVGRGPTSFFFAHEVMPSIRDEDQTQMLFIDAFLQNNRLDHITQVMGYHPQYLDSFLRTQHFILRGDGPLPYDYRHYIAIMAAARHQCSYLVNLQKQEFLIQGGNPAWLEGLHRIPKKLYDLYEINKILAHRPWLINKSHIAKLTKGKDNWSLSEVVHAIVLLTHFHALSCFVYGCGINDEIDDLVGHTYRPPSLSEMSSDTDGNNSSSPAGSDVEGGVEELMSRMKKLSEHGQEETSLEEKVKRFMKVESQAVELSTGSNSPTAMKADIPFFIHDPDFDYQDFARRGDNCDIPTFRVQDYSWDDHGFSLVNRLYNEVGTLLDEKFKTAYNLTYYTMGTKSDVDTSLFRRAIWNYIHCMFGIRHDDYDYAEVNQLLERELKAYIKTVCCYPFRTSKKSYNNVMRDFRHSEKVHVNLMMLEARMQAGLLYALRAVMKYMT